MKEAQNQRAAKQNESGKLRGWRDDAFARHEVYLQMLWWWPLVIVMAIAGTLWRLRPCAAPSATP